MTMHTLKPAYKYALCYIYFFVLTVMLLLSLKLSKDKKCIIFIDYTDK